MAKREKNYTTILGDPIKTLKTKDPDEGLYDVDRIVDALKKDCSQILRYYKTQPPLWRGISLAENENDPLMLKKGHMQDKRDPRDMPEEIHDFINDFMMKKIKWPIRNGVPVTTQYNQSRSYGVPRMFFPFNGFKFAFIPKVYDLYLKLDMINHKWTGHILTNKGTNDFLKSAGAKKEAEKLLSTVETKSWAKHNGEVFFNTKFYYLYDPMHMGFGIDDKGDPEDRSYIIFQKLGIFKGKPILKLT